MKVFSFLILCICFAFSTGARDYCNEQVFDTVFARLCEPNGRCVNEDSRPRCVFDDSTQKTESDYYCSLDIFGQSASSLCNLGKCIGSKEGTRCVCPPGYSGDNCENETEIDFCSLSYAGRKATDRCKNGGVCVNKHNGTECECLPSFSGATCHTKTETKNISEEHNIECYSCMSAHAQRLFDGMYSMLYNDPVNFTDSCERDSLDVQVLEQYKKNCSDVCIELKFQDKLLGMQRDTFLRGCLSDIRNYNESAVSVFMHRDHCAHMLLNSLFRRGRNPPIRFGQNDSVSICSCHNNLCNVV